MNLKVPVKKIHNTIIKPPAGDGEPIVKTLSAFSKEHIQPKVAAGFTATITQSSGRKQWPSKKIKERRKKKQPEGWTLRAQSHSRLVKPFNPCPPDSWPLSLQH